MVDVEPVDFVGVFPLLFHSYFSKPIESHGFASAKMAFCHHLIPRWRRTKTIRGLPDFSCATYQNGKNILNNQKIYQMAVK
jgi:hypothetical protein